MFGRMMRFFFGSLIASVGAGIAFVVMRELIEEEQRKAQTVPPAQSNGSRPSSTGAKRVKIQIQDDEDDKDDEPVTLSTREAGEVLGITPAEVRALIDDGLLPAHKEGRYWAIYESDVLKYKADNE